MQSLSKSIVIFFVLPQELDEVKNAGQCYASIFDVHVVSVANRPLEGQETFFGVRRCRCWVFRVTRAPWLAMTLASSYNL